MLADWHREAVGAEEGPDVAALALERLRRGRVVQEHDPERAQRDLPQAGVDRVDLAHALRVDLAQQRLAEVGHVRAGEAADEALAADDADLGPGHVEDPVVAVEHVDAAVGERRRHLVAAVGVPVVVAEYGEDGHLRVAGRVGEDRRLLGLAVRREVAGQEDEVDAAAEALEGRGPVLAVAVAAAVDVAGGGDPHAAVRGLRGRLPLRDDGHALAGTRSGRVGTRPACLPRTSPTSSARSSAPPPRCATPASPSWSAGAWRAGPAAAPRRATTSTWSSSARTSSGRAGRCASRACGSRTRPRNGSSRPGTATC